MLQNTTKPVQRIDEIISTYGVNNIRAAITFDDQRLEYNINPNQYRREGQGGKLYLTSVNVKITDLTVSTGEFDNWIIKGIADVYVITPDGHMPISYTLTNQ